MKSLKNPTFDQLQTAAVDITKPQVGVEVNIDELGKVIHVNVDGLCVLRICRIPELKVNIIRKV